MLVGPLQYCKPTMHGHTLRSWEEKKDLLFIYLSSHEEEMRARRCCAIKNTESAEIAHPQPKAPPPSHPDHSSNYREAATKRYQKSRLMTGTAIKTVGDAETVHMTKQHLSCFANPIHQAPQKQQAAVLTLVSLQEDRANLRMTRSLENR